MFHRKLRDDRGALRTDLCDVTVDWELAATAVPVRAKYFEIIEGREQVREYESSPGKFRAFCSNCGSPIYSRRPADPDIRRVRLSTIDSDPGRRPKVHVWTGSKSSWFDITDSLPQIAGGGPPATRKPGD